MSEVEYEMQVRKRNGLYENIAFDKILNRVKILGKENNLMNINYSGLIMKVIDQLYDKIPTSNIDELTLRGNIPDNKSVVDPNVNCLLLIFMSLTSTYY